jgi:hypothetical protein
MRGYHCIATALIWGFIALSVWGTVVPVVSYSKNTGLLGGVFYQDSTSDGGTHQALLLSQKRGISTYVSRRNMILGPVRWNIDLYYTNMGSYYYGPLPAGTVLNDDYLMYQNVWAKWGVEIPLSHGWDGLLGLSYTGYIEDPIANSKPLFTNQSDVGVMVGIQRDTRNREINSTSGYFNTLSATLYAQRLQLVSDVRWFVPLPPKSTLATRVYTTYTRASDRHIAYDPCAGSYFYMRGYQPNTFCDAFIGFAQVEYRFEWRSFMHLAPFIEAGGMGTQLFSMNQPLLSYGLAIHIPIGPVSLRIEPAFSNNNRAFYFGFNHVF